MTPNSVDPVPGGERRWSSRAQKVALPVVLSAGAVVFGLVVNFHYPISQWLFWRYAGYWLLTLVFCGACVSSGHALLRRVLGHPLPVYEHLSLSFAVGVYLFFLGMRIGGLAGLYGPVFFVALPLAMLAATGRASLRTARRLYRHLRATRARAARPPAWALPIAAFGLLGLGMVYFAILTPENVAFDARWQHLGIAEHYAAEGAARRFPEGWFVGSSPHLTSYLFTWAFLRPKSALFDRVELSAHIEFGCFLFTLVGIPALVRLVLRRGKGGRSLRVPSSLLGLSWVARFLFPGVFLYDSSLCAGADHIAAIFAIPLYTLLIRAYRDLSPRLCALLALMLASVFMTKYTGIVILAGFPVLAIAARAAWLLFAEVRRRMRGLGEAPRPAFAWAKGPLVAALGCVVFSAPHWAPNWVFYGDPLYPMLHKLLPLAPWTPESSERFQFGFNAEEAWRPSRDLHGLWQTFKALFTYSFIPNDWSKFHGAVPVFGSLFTLLLFCLPFVRGKRRVVGLFAAVHLGILCWYWVRHQDRYLQVILPWMAAATAAAIVLIWQTHLAARVALAGLIALQVIWGGDVYFISGHAMVGSPIDPSLRLISSGYRKATKERDQIFRPYSEIAAVLPAKAKVLVHEHHTHLGLGAMSVKDFSVDQGGISYGRLGAPHKVYDLFKSYGVTHLLWGTTVSHGMETLADDLVFFNFALRYGVAPRGFGGFTLAAMPAAPPKEGDSDVVAVLACPGGPADGLYHLDALNVPIFGPRRGKYPPPFRAPASDGSDGDALVSAAAYAVVDPRCKKELPATGKASFQLAARRKGVDLWIRR